MLNRSTFNLLQGTRSRARAGAFTTSARHPRQTPVFAPVGTQATVKAVSTSPNYAGDRRERWCSPTPITSTCAPARNLVAAHGRLAPIHALAGTHAHRFRRVSRSSRYPDTRKVDQDGVTFKSPHRRLRAPLSPPESSIGSPGAARRGYHHGF